MSSSARTLGDFVDTDQIFENTFPLSVNGHTVEAVEPAVNIAGADDDVAFECTDCGEQFYPKADRVVDDQTYVENRFGQVPCRTDSVV
jgi:hypothetical protein